MRGRDREKERYNAISASGGSCSSYSRLRLASAGTAAVYVGIYVYRTDAECSRVAFRVQFDFGFSRIAFLFRKFYFHFWNDFNKIASLITKEKR